MTFLWFGKQTNLDTLDKPLFRAERLRYARIAVIDDDQLEMLKDLQAQGLAIDHLASSSDARFHLLEEGHYDLLLLDFGGIGASFGRDDGLDVLRHLKRVNPSLRVLAFTGRSLDSSRADFFRLCDGVARKDAGIREMLELIELQLAEVLTVKHQWNSLKTALGPGVSPSQIKALEKELDKAIKSPSYRDQAAGKLAEVGKSAATRLTEKLLGKIIELGAAYLAGKVGP